VAAAITGKTPAGEPIKGDYKFTDEFPMAEGFRGKRRVLHPDLRGQERRQSQPSRMRASRQCCGCARVPKAAASTNCRPTSGWAVADTYGLLTEVDQATPFISAVSQGSLRMAYIVTDDDRRFQAIAKRLPDGMEPVRLYESYLTNFSFANGE
jgi:adenine-specific DNA-methyltransferase